MMKEKIRDEAELDDLLSMPDEALIKMMSRLDGDIMILGSGGKIGVSLGAMAVKAAKLAKVKKTVYGVDLFLDESSRKALDASGVKTIKADLMSRESVATLPVVPNVIYMVGRKFGTAGTEDLTWALNVTVPVLVAEHFKKSRTVVFSTGCVYPLVSVEGSGCSESVPPAPVGDYAQSSLGRERVFQHYSRANGTPTLLYRLNYAIDLRYGVLSDIGLQIWNGQPVDLSAGHFNVIWQGDANRLALRSLEYCESPAAILNVTGPETASVAAVAERMGKLMGREVKFAGKQAGRCYLNDASKSHAIFGYPSVSLQQMIVWQAEWIMNGGRTLGKPTHFEVSDGKF